MIRKKKKRQSTEVNASSMADIAFLLLIFFLVTTTIASDKGLSILLPPEKKDDIIIDLKKKNVFTILVNSSDKLLVEDQPMDPSELKEACKKFLTNRGKDPKSSDSPLDAITSIKTDRGTSYDIYIYVMDEVKKAYNECRAEFVGLTLEEYNAIDKEDKKSKGYDLYEKARTEFPLQISEAEPSKIGG